MGDSVSLRKHLVTRIEHVSDVARIHAENARDALGLAAKIAEEHRLAARELSEELRAQAQKYPTREALDMKTGELERRVDAFGKTMASMEQKLANIEGRVLSVGAVVVVTIALVQIALRLVGK